MIERTHPKLSVGTQCRLLTISRASFYYALQGETAMNLDLMLLIDKQFLETPFYGVRQMTWHLRNEGHAMNEKRIRRLMRLMRVRRENSPPDCFLPLLTADLPKAQHQQARKGAQDLPLSAGRAADRQVQSGLVRRHHVSARLGNRLASQGRRRTLDHLLQPPEAPRHSSGNRSTGPISDPPQTWQTAARRGLLQEYRNRPAGAGSSLNQPKICPRIGE